MAEGFEPVLLNLADMEDYAVLVAALHDYASRLDVEADEEDASARVAGMSTPVPWVDDARRGAARARALVDNVESQLDANNAARRRASG